MKKNKFCLALIAIFLLLVGFFELTQLTSAQESTLNSQSLRIICLNAVKAGTHTVKLQGSGFEPGKRVEIWRKTHDYGFQCALDKNGVATCCNPEETNYEECVNTFTSSNSKDSQQLEFKVPNKTREEITADQNGNIVVEKVLSETIKTQMHIFYGVQEITTVPMATEQSESYEATGFSQKLSVFTHEEDIPFFETDSTDCTTVYWDPYGIVFDTVSLEPIANTKVALLNQDQSLVPNQPGVINPNITEDNGAFSFIVPDGTYYLQPKKTGFLFPLAKNEIDNLALRQSIYTDLYRGEPIVQQGKIEHRDIPLKPKNPKQAVDSAPKIVSVEVMAVKKENNSYQKIIGFVSHPNSIIHIYSDSRQIAEVKANNQGSFEVLIDNKLINQTAGLEIQAEKVDLLTGQTTKSKNALSQLQKIDPIAPFLIGYVYNPKNSLAKNAKVEIKVPLSSKKPYITTYSNRDGLTYLPSTLIPSIGYQLQITTGQKTFQITPQDFIEQNEDFYQATKINVYDTAMEKTYVEQINNQQFYENQIQTEPSNLKKSKEMLPVADNQTEDKISKVLLIGMALIVILGIAGLIVILKKRNSSPPLS